MLPDHWLSVGLGSGAQQSINPQYFAAVGDPAVVDLIFDPRLCLDGHIEKQRYP
ncbi:hypothetical protein D3C80_1877970 [compost metagenome]